KLCLQFRELDSSEQITASRNQEVLHPECCFLLSAICSVLCSLFSVLCYLLSVICYPSSNPKSMELYCLQPSSTPSTPIQRCAAPTKSGSCAAAWLTAAARGGFAICWSTIRTPRRTNRRIASIRFGPPGFPKTPRRNASSWTFPSAR